MVICHCIRELQQLYMASTLALLIILRKQEPEWEMGTINNNNILIIMLLGIIIMCNYYSNNYINNIIIITTIIIGFDPTIPFEVRYHPVWETSVQEISYWWLFWTNKCRTIEGSRLLPKEGFYPGLATGISWFAPSEPSRGLDSLNRGHHQMHRGLRRIDKCAIKWWRFILIKKSKKDTQLWEREPSKDAMKFSQETNRCLFVLSIQGQAGPIPSEDVCQERCALQIHKIISIQTALN